jgi:acetyl esterase/lipase
VTHSTIDYGRHHAQQADIWRPEGAGPGDLPVVVLIHGGFWRQLYTKRLMHGLAKAVTAHGWAAFNIEYRRVGAFGSGGWPATFDDVSAAVDALAGVPGVDCRRVVTCGHSAGGHLALWAATDRRTDSTGTDHVPVVRPCAAISLAGVVDLVAGSTLGLGGGAVDALMGGPPTAHPERYHLGSPAELLPLGVPQFLVHGLRDGTVPAHMSEEYAVRATAVGDPATYVPLAEASHMDMIAGRGAAFSAIAAALDGLGPGG